MLNLLFEKVAFSGLQNAKNADLQGILWILTTLLLGFPKTVHSVNTLRQPLTPSSLLQKWLDVSTPAIQQQLCSISPPINSTFWGTSQTWDIASPQGKDTKGILFTKRCCHFFSNDLGFNFKFPPKTYITHIIFAEKKNDNSGNHLSPSFHQIPGQESKPLQKESEKKENFAPRMMVIHWWWSSAASSLKPNIHSRLCKKWPQESLKKKLFIP